MTKKKPKLIPFKNKMIAGLITVIPLSVISGGLITAGLSEKIVIPFALVFIFLATICILWRLK